MGLEGTDRFRASKSPLLTYECASPVEIVGLCYSTNLAWPERACVMLLSGGCKQFANSLGEYFWPMQPTETLSTSTKLNDSPAIALGGLGGR